jgi:filamentous hemagglutinin family protein
MSSSIFNPSQFLFFGLSLTSIILGLTQNNTIAQISPDSTLPNNSAISINGNNIIIQGGTQVGTNLFHSFQEFSVSTGNAAIFNNGINISNILTRVTGNNASFIDGLIKTNGTANLFFMNPNGIIFGSNSALLMEGSFLGTTANSIIFSDGTRFSAIHPNTSSLSISTPIGLNFAENPGIIQIQGEGHQLSSSFPTPVFGERGRPNLLSSSGNNLALIGGDIVLDGGIILSLGGNLDLGSVGKGTVIFDVNQSDWSFDYSQSESFKNINFLTRALLDATGLSESGSINLQARNITLQDGSVILIQNLGSKPSGAIEIEATESFKLSGTDPISEIIGAVRTETLGSGMGGNIQVFTPKLSLIEGGQILSTNFQSGEAGNIFVNVSETLEIVGSSPISPLALSSIISLSVGAGNAGDINISAGNLSIRDGATVSASSIGVGEGGQANIKVRDTLEISGIQPILGFPSSIASVALNQGNAGSVIVDTTRLILQNGGEIQTGTGAFGNAGSIFINSSESIVVEGDSSQIISSVTAPDEITKQTFGLPDIPTGNSGEVRISTPQLTLLDNAQIAVTNEGLGDGGILVIQASSLFLNQSDISASTQVGNGGNINITSHMIRSSNSEISATAGGTGNGGNINANLILLLDESSISANSFEGDGGNINITSQGLFVSPDSSISASSQFGIDGEVNIDTNFFEGNPADTGLPDTNLSIDQRVAQFCDEAQKKSRFTVEGRQGMIRSPENYSRPYDLTDLAPLGEVIGVEKLPDGRVRLLSCKRVSQGDSQEN